MGSRVQNIQWTEFGWQGIRFEVPADWNLSAVNGAQKSGYLRLDDGELIRLELRWEESKASKKLTIKQIALRVAAVLGASVFSLLIMPHPITPIVVAGFLAYKLQLVGRKVDLPISSTVDKYIDSLRKRAKKQKLTFRNSRDDKLVRFDDREYECFGWRSDIQAFGLMMRCDECKRLICVEIRRKRGENMKEVAKRSFYSLVDHPVDGKRLWSVYDFKFYSPTDFRLENSSLKTGCLELSFVHKGEEIEAVRLSLGEMLLKNQSMEDWFKGFYQKKLKGYRCQMEEVEFKEHRGLKCAGKLSFRAGIKNLVRRRRYIHCRVWHCDETDKIYVFRLTSAQQDDPRLDEFAQLVECHSVNGQISMAKSQ